MSDTPDRDSVEFVPLNLLYDGDLHKKNTAHESEGITITFNGITISVRNEHDTILAATLIRQLMEL